MEVLLHDQDLNNQAVVDSFTGVKLAAVAHSEIDNSELVLEQADVSDNTVLEQADMSDNTVLEQVDSSDNTVLEQTNFSDNQIIAKTALTDKSALKADEPLPYVAVQSLVPENIQTENVVHEDTLTVEPALPAQSHFDEQLLLTVPEANYALMLGGYSKLDVLENVTSKLSDFSEIYQYKTIRNGKPWYVLLYGSFATRAIANEALDSLPSHVSSFSPWPKPYASIHQEIAAFASTNIDKK